MELLAAERAHDDAAIGATSLPRMFHDAVDRHRERKAQMYKGGVHDRSLTDRAMPLAPDGAYTSLTYHEMETLVVALADGFRRMGVEPGDRVAIAAHTRMEWALCDLALLGIGATVVTVYPESSERRIRYLLEDSGATAAVVEGAALRDRVLAVAEDDGIDLGFVATMDDRADVGEAVGESDAGGADAGVVHAGGIDVVDLDAVHARGEVDRTAHMERVDAVDLDHLASLVYTSGTTGQPKGVELTHRNVRANVNQVRRRFAPRDDRDDDVPVIDQHSRTVSFLPLAHVFERLAGHFLMFASGATVAYAESPDTLREDFGQVRPTTGTSVPRVYERMYAAVRDEATTSGLKERIFGWATGVARRFQRADAPGPLLRLQHRLADRLVFRSVRAALGGEVEMLISGGGSLSPDLAALYHGMGLPMVEGYGLTETSPVLAVNPPEAPRIGTVGPPVTGVATAIDEDVAVASRDERDGGGGDGPAGERGGEDGGGGGGAGGGAGDGERATGAVGELLVRGPNVTRGYWDDPDATETAFVDAVPEATVEPAPGGAAAEDDVGGVADGDSRWFRTGDVVERRSDGYLAFRERLKQLLVLSTGKNVAPRPIENLFATEPLVAQCMVVGDGRKFVGALIVPAMDAVLRRADDEDVALPEDDGAAVEHDAVHEWIEEAVERASAELESYETIKRFRLVPEEWTEESGMLTPTMKKKRRAILDEYGDLVDAIYEDA